jgi:hypothetical protein
MRRLTGEAVGYRFGKAAAQGNETELPKSCYQWNLWTAEVEKRMCPRKTLLHFVL